MLLEETIDEWAKIVQKHKSTRKFEVLKKLTPCSQIQSIKGRREHQLAVGDGGPPFGKTIGTTIATKLMRSNRRRGERS